MNYGRGFPLPRYGNGDMLVLVNEIQPDNGIGQNMSSWGAAMLGGESLGETQRRPILNYGRGFPLPRYGNGDIRVPVNEIQPDNGIRQNMSSWGAAMLGAESLGETQRRPILNYGRGFHLPRYGKSGSSSWTPAKPTIQRSNLVVRDNLVNQVENENWDDLVRTYKDLLNKEETLNMNKVAQDICTTIVRSKKSDMNSGRGFPLPRYGKSGSSSWTPAKPTIQRSNLVVRDNLVNQVESENWDDLVGMYKDLLSEEENLNMNKVAQDICTTNPPPTVQNRVVSTPNRNLNTNQILYSTPVSTPNQAPPSGSYFPSEGPSNWDGRLLDAVVRPKKSSASEPFENGSQNSSVYDLNRIPVLNSSIQVGSNSAQVGSMLGKQQSLLIGGYNSNPLPTDGFPVLYCPCYDLNSPPRSVHEAASSGITEPSLLAPITPDTRPKQIDNQWTPTKDGEDADKHYSIGDLMSSAVSTTLKEHLIAEKGDELGIDLNKTPNQMN